LCQQVHAAAQQITSVTDQGQQQHCTVILDSVACVSALAGGDTGQLHALLHTLEALGENLQVSNHAHLCSSSSMYRGFESIAGSVCQPVVPCQHPVPARVTHLAANI
jgi:hypothetical protein